MLLAPLALSLLAALGSAFRTTEEDTFTLSPDLTLKEGESEVVFIRHGLSLNNVFKDDALANVVTMGRFITSPIKIVKGLIGGKETMAKEFQQDWAEAPDSEFKRGYETVCNVQKLCGNYGPLEESTLMWEIARLSRDCLLHPTFGDAGAAELSRTLSTVLPQKHFFDKVFVSPLRRTLQTAIRALGPWMNETNTVVLPWIHETFKSDSDKANPGLVNTMFLGRYKGLVQPDRTLTGAIKAMQDDLLKLGDWVEEYGPRDPSIDQPDAPISKAKHNEHTDLAFYPGLDGTFSSKESQSELEERMVIVRRLLAKLPPGRYALVSHGGIGHALFGKKFKNLAVMTARFRRTADPTNKNGFFHDVKWGSERWGNPDILGERDH